MQSLNNTFLSLVRLGIGHRTEALSDPVNWNEVQALAERQGLAAVLVDGIEQLPDNQRPPKDLLLQWIGEVLQNYEYRYELYRRAIAELAGFYNQHGLKMMILKGYACSLNWPNPKHRPCGDVDIWLFEKQQEADRLLKIEKKITIDNSHHHHTVFSWKGFLVENHYDFENVHHHKSSMLIEKIFKELGKDDTHMTVVNGQNVFLPSPNLHALFLLKHSMTDFAAFYVTLRQVLDWAFFVEKHGKEVDWNWLLKILDEFHMRDFFDCVNGICVEDLGFDSNIFPYVKYNQILKDRVLSDILSPKFSRGEPKCLFPRLVFKYRRWLGNSWKHQMCYNESMWSAFWSGLWGHLMKPSSL